MSASDLATISFFAKAFGILAFFIVGAIIGLMATDNKKTKNTDIGKINRDFRKRIERHYSRIEKRRKIKAIIIAIFSKIWS